MYFIKQKTAYEMRISDCSSDVCSSDLAEGRLILCDALTEADSEKPDLLIDFATLTGAARVALGPELPAFFCNDDKLAGVILRQGAAEGDPIWRLPLHKPYGQGLDSKVADLNNISGSPKSEEHTSELQYLMRTSYDIFRLT